MSLRYSPEHGQNEIGQRSALHNVLYTRLLQGLSSNAERDLLDCKDSDSLAPPKPPAAFRQCDRHCGAFPLGGAQCDVARVFVIEQYAVCRLTCKQPGSVSAVSAPQHGYRTMIGLTAKWPAPLTGHSRGANTTLPHLSISEQPPLQEIGTSDHAASWFQRREPSFTAAAMFVCSRAS